MKEQSSVVLRGFPNVSGKVIELDGDDVVVKYDNARGDVVRHEAAELIEVTDVHLPGDDKAWPPPGLETKARST